MLNDSSAVIMEKETLKGFDYNSPVSPEARSTRGNVTAEIPARCSGHRPGEQTEGKLKYY